MTVFRPRGLVGEAAVAERRDGLAEGLQTALRAARREEPPESEPERRSLLLADRDEDDRAFVARLLSSAEHIDFHVSFAADAESALQRFDHGGADICVLDWDMPGAREVLAPAFKSGRPATPFVFLSDRADRAVENEAIALGAADLLDKDDLDVGRLERAVRFAIARQRAADRLDQLASQDHLTGLANRAAFMRRVEDAAARARRRRGVGGLVLLDLNDFKPVNDEHGHLAGDALLIDVGRRLRAITRETDLVARLGGDEFGLVIEQLAAKADVIRVANKIATALEAPFAIEGGAVTLSASIGVAVFPGDGDDATTLRAHADAAMYAAKAEGGSRCKFHDQALDSRALQGSKDGLRLAQALRSGALSLRFAPQVRLAADDWAFRAEPCLLDGDMPLDGPALRAAAEQAGLVEPLTEWLLNQVCDQAAQWRRAGTGASVRISAPLWSRRALSWGGIADRLSDQLRRFGLDADAVELEIDGALLADDAARGGGSLTRLARLGARIAVADIDAPALSLAALSRLPIKTARASVDGKCDRELQATAAFLHHLGCRSVATSAGDLCDLKKLRAFGFSAVEALGVSQPLAADAALAWMARAAHKDSREI